MRRRGWAGPSNATYSSGTTDPIQMVNWYDAIAFCNKLSLLEGLTPVYAVSGVDFAALTYAQIPAADGDGVDVGGDGCGHGAPGVTNTSGYSKAFAGSTGSNAIGDYAWYSTNSASKTHPAGTKLPNELGLYDLSGNVYEFVWDWYAAHPTGTLMETRGGGFGRQPRGMRGRLVHLCVQLHRGRPERLLPVRPGLRHRFAGGSPMSSAVEIIL
jgi:hypothetical protein